MNSSQLRLRIGYWLIAWLCGVVSLSGKERLPQFRFVERPVAQWVGDSLSLRFVAGLEGELSRATSFHLQPQYLLPGDTINLPQQSWYTPSGLRYHRRRLTFDGQPIEEQIVVAERTEASPTAAYTTLRHLPKGGTVRLLLYSQTCCDATRLDTFRLVSAPRVVPRFRPDQVTFVEPPAEVVKERAESLTVRVVYPLDKWDIRPELAHNQQELDLVDSLLATITAHTECYVLKRLAIVGYASPEGPYHHNIFLSRQRAESMSAYIGQRYALPDSLSIASVGRGEDWAGLREAVTHLQTPWQLEVLDILDRYDEEPRRERTLMRLQGGAPYAYLLKNVYPPLRRMEMEVSYQVRPFRTDEAESWMDCRPQDLSLLEWYQVASKRNDAARLESDRAHYGEEWLQAAAHFPEDDLANLNASSVALLRGDAALAKGYLDKVKQTALADNNRGLYLWLTGDLAGAEEAFRRAQAHGSSEAERNLAQIKLERAKEGYATLEE